MTATALVLGTVAASASACDCQKLYGAPVYDTLDTENNSATADSGDMDTEAEK